MATVLFTRSGLSSSIRWQAGLSIIMLPFMHLGPIVDLPAIVLCVSPLTKLLMFPILAAILIRLMAYRTVFVRIIVLAPLPRP